MTFEAALAVFVPPSLPLIITSAGLRCPPCCPLEKRQEKDLRFNPTASSIHIKPHQDHLNQPPCRANHNHCTWFLARDGRSWKAAAKSAERCGGGGGRHNCTVLRSFCDLLVFCCTSCRAPKHWYTRIVGLWEQILAVISTVAL